MLNNENVQPSNPDAADDARFRLAMEHAPDGFSILQPVRNKNGAIIDFTWIYENPENARMNGTAPQRIVGKRLLERFPTSRGTSVFETYRYVANSGNVRIMEDFHVGDDASKPTWLRLVVIPIGADIAIQAQDITERKQVEEALQSSNSLLTAALESTAEGILVVNLNGVIMRYNENFARMWRIPQEVLDCRDDAAAFNPILDQLVDPRGFLTRIEQLHAQPETSSFDSIEFKDGRLFERYSQPQRVGVEIVGRVWAFRDFTERKRAEAEKEKLLLQVQKARRLDAIGRLAGGVAHDFNNTLMGVSGYAELCRSAIPPGHPAIKWVDAITQGVEHAADLTRQLLAFARQQPIAPKVMAINDAVGKMLKMLRRLIGEDIDLDWQPGADLWAVRLDPGQLDQILANLCINARDAIGTRAGRITLETRNAPLDAAFCADQADANPGEHVLLTIRDNGCGMDRETLDKIFEPFFTNKRLDEGCGLGLATVYGIVKQNNGFLSVDSEPGKGSSFHIYLPRVEAEDVVADKDVAEEPRQAPASAGNPPHGGNETVMLVEDEKNVRFTLNILLKGLGYSVLVAESPEVALRLVTEHADGIDLLLTDVIMPGMSGRELAETLTSRYPAMKVLYMSGYSADVIAHHGILEEGVNFVSKPVTRDALAGKIREVLGSAPAGGMNAQWRTASESRP